ncbi:MAG: hypothetical protein KGK18_15595 [Burkholderiales bacterium]|nr:hypothetical protein [Burkholderiales bacterium]
MMTGGIDPRRFRFADDEGKRWPVQAHRASVPNDVPRLEHRIMSATARMAPTRTVAPQGPFEFKRRPATQATDRPRAERRRGLRQADIVQLLLDQGMLTSAPSSVTRPA